MGRASLFIDAVMLTLARAKTIRTLVLSFMHFIRRGLADSKLSALSFASTKAICGAPMIWDIMLTTDCKTRLP